MQLFLFDPVRVVHDRNGGRADVDDVLAKGLAAGGSEPREPQDLGFMYSRDLEDPDGNVLEFLYMDPAAAEQGPEAFLGDQD